MEDVVSFCTLMTQEMSILIDPVSPTHYLDSLLQMKMKKWTSEHPKYTY